MQITLRIDGKEKTFSNDFVSARIFRNALMLNKEMRQMAEISVEMFDTMVEFVVSVFNKQFTVDEFWDGIEASKLSYEVMRIFNETLSFGGLATQSAEGNESGK